ncbi:hypothetical protein [Ruegeria arenilitoris]|uniref:hypothetical protein n=1 Tax=Ruegeria arenilitoris TaxID=1173585 RepID=UPI00147FDCF5|nr:hypothetical protein [Ruegeria arenilitoris]
MTVTIYQPIELAEYCYLSEAVEFLALGRAPERHLDTHPPKDTDGSYIFDLDARFNWRSMPDNFEPAAFYLHTDFTQAEAEFAGISLPDDYRATSDSFHIGEIGNAITTLEVDERLSDYVLADELMGRREKQVSAAQETLSVNAEAIERFHAANALFEPCFELAWSKLFQAMHSGSLVVEAIDLARWERLADDEQYEAAGQFISLPCSAFPLGFDFHQNSITHEGVEFVCARVKVQSVLSLFAGVVEAGQQVSAKAVGSTLVIAQSTESGPRRRGAPFIVDWNKVRQHLIELGQNGSLPEKKEARIQIAIEFCKHRFGKSVARTTLQNRLREQLDI